MTLAGITICEDDLGHRVTAHPEERIAYTVVKPDPDEPPTGYTLDTAQPGDHPGGPVPSAISTFTGLPETPPELFTLPPATSANPAAEDTVVATDGTSTHTIYHSKRAGCITRWASAFPDYGIDQEWLIRIGSEGYGSSINPNTRWIERLFTAGSAMCNPTTGGTSLRPVENDDLNDNNTSPSLHHSNAGGGPGVAFCKSAVIPLQWDSDGLFEHPLTNHGGTATRVLAWGRFRYANHTDPYYGGRAHIQRVTSFSFSPKDWDEADYGGNIGSGGNVVRFQFNESLPVFTWEIFDEAYAYDCATNTLTDLTSVWSTLADPGFGAIELWKDRTRYLDDWNAPDGPSLVPSGYAAAILRRSSDGFTVAFATKIGDQSTVLDYIGKASLPQNLALNRMLTGIVIADPDIGGDDAAGLGCNVSSFVGRRVGWHGMVGYLFVGHSDPVLGALQELFTSGLLDEAPDPSLIPEEAYAGTELADGLLAGSTDSSTSLSGAIGAITTVMPPLVVNTPLFFPPEQVGEPILLRPPLLPRESVVHAPQIAVALAPGLVTTTNLLPTHVCDVGVAAGLATTSTSVFDPSFGQGLGPPRINPTRSISP